jgi:hypothetical protein
MKRIVEVRLNGATAYEMSDKTFEYISTLVVLMPRRYGARMPIILKFLNPTMRKSIKIINNYKTVRGLSFHSIYVDERVQNV